jgi:DNA-binding NarL/FixJ family response regulator
MITIFVADDHKAFRQYMCEQLSNISCLEVVGNAENGEIAAESVCKIKPDVVFMDVRMPVMNGIEATRLIKSQCPQVKIIAFSTFYEKEVIDQMLEAGACSYLQKGDGLSQIVAAIKAAITGQEFKPIENYQNIF